MNGERVMIKLHMCGVHMIPRSDRRESVPEDASAIVWSNEFELAVRFEL